MSTISVIFERIISIFMSILTIFTVSTSSGVKTICTDSRGTWVEDHQKNEIRHEKNGETLFVLRLEDAKTVKDINKWTTEKDGDLIYVYNDDGSLISIIDMPWYGVLSSTYGEIYT